MSDTMDINDKLMKVVNRVVQGLTEKDFVESLFVAEKWWDVYRFRAPLGTGFIAFRIAPEGHVEVAAMKRTMSELKAVLFEEQN